MGELMDGWKDAWMDGLMKTQLMAFRPIIFVCDFCYCVMARFACSSRRGGMASAHSRENTHPESGVRSQ